MAPKSVSFRNMSDHVEDLADGRTVPVGEFVSLTAEEQDDPHNKRLIDEGVFGKVEESNDKKKEGGSD